MSVDKHHSTVITIATELAILDFLEEMETLVDADDGVVFQLQHIEMIEELKERLDSSDKLYGEYYVI